MYMYMYMCMYIYVYIFMYMYMYIYILLGQVLHRPLIYFTYCRYFLFGPIYVIQLSYVIIRSDVSD